MVISGAKEKIHAACRIGRGLHGDRIALEVQNIVLETGNRPHTCPRFVDIPFPMEVRNDLVTAGRTGPHYVLPESGWVSVYMKEATDVDRAIELLRLSFEIAEQRVGNEGNPRAVGRSAETFCRIPE